MRAPLVALALAVLVVVAATGILSGADEPLAPASAADPPASSWHARVVSFDGATMAITVYQPAGASAAAPVPVIVHSHGWGGTRIQDGTGLPGLLWNAGYGVVTVDARGHGESQGLAQVHHANAEVKDWSAILDWIHDELDWVQKEPTSTIPNDIIAGGAGYSYAGAIQLQSAAHDGRLDALAPEITWTDLPYALAPAGNAKSIWLDILIGYAIQGGVRYNPQIDAWYREILLTGEVPQDALDHFAGSNPPLEQIRADVLFIQGMPDVLFNANQAIRGHQRLEAAGAGDIRLVTHLTGHVLPTLQPLGATPRRAITFEAVGPCGDNAQMILAWMDQHLRHGPESAIPEIAYALDDGTCATLDAHLTTTHTTPLGTIPLNTAAPLLLPLDTPPGLLAGTPHLRANVTAPTPTLAYASLVVIDNNGHHRILDDQTHPLRLLPGKPLDTDLAAIATRLHPGDRLHLRLDGANEWYAHNSQRTPSIAILTDATLTLPHDE